MYLNRFRFYSSKHFNIKLGKLSYLCLQHFLFIVLFFEDPRWVFSVCMCYTVAVVSFTEIKFINLKPAEVAVL